MCSKLRSGFPRRSRCLVLLVASPTSPTSPSPASPTSPTTPPSSSQSDRIWSDAKKKKDIPAEELLQETAHRPFSPKTMVAAGMSSRGALRPHFIPRGIKIASLEYQRIVEDYYIPEGCAMFDAPVGDWELQQDNAPSHVSKSTIKFFKKSGLRLTGWPPHSPDLNPLDFACWGAASRKLAGNHFPTEQLLKVAVVQAWNEVITPQFCEGAVANVVRRCKMCVEAKGGHFEHLL